MYASRYKTRISFRAFFSLIYINELATELKSNDKLFADISLFSIVSNPLEIANILSKDLGKIRGCAEQWEMAFILIRTQQNKLKKSFFQEKPSEIFSS